VFRQNGPELHHTGKAHIHVLNRPCELTDCATLRTFIKDIVNESRRHLTAGLGRRSPTVSRPFDGVDAVPRRTKCQRLLVALALRANEATQTPVSKVSPP
jgi:hypothetical protein